MSNSLVAAIKCRPSNGSSAFLDKQSANAFSPLLRVTPNEGGTISPGPNFFWTNSSSLKGKLGDFFLFVQSFYRPKTKTTFNRQFSPKSPKMGQKSGQRVQNSQNKDPTVNSGFRPTVGIHQFWLPSYCGNPFIYWSGFPQ